MVYVYYFRNKYIHVSMQEFINKSFFSLFVITLIFGILLYDLIGFDYTDEICASVLFLLFGYQLFKTPEWTINKAFLFTLLVFGFYFCYSIFIGSNITKAIITDLIIQIKPYLALFCTYSLAPLFSNDQKIRLRLTALIFSFFLFLLAIVEIFVPNTLVVVMGHATYYAAAVIMCSLCYLYTSPYTTKTKITFLLILALGLISGRSKFFGFYAFASILVLFLSVKLDNFKLNLKSISILLAVVAVVILVAWEKISFYFFQTFTGEVDRDNLARFVLYRTAPDILVDYAPFGSGFASFGTFASGQYYSDIYIKYGIEKVWGISQDFYNYVADTYYPSLAQFGIVGVLLYVLFWLYIAKKAFNFYKVTKNNFYPTFVILIIVFFIIEGVADSTFTTHRGFFILMFLGLLLGDMKRILTSTLNEKKQLPKHEDITNQ